MSKRTKIDVYLSKDHKQEIQKKASSLDLSLSDYMKLKALDLLTENEKNVMIQEGYDITNKFLDKYII